MNAYTPELSNSIAYDETQPEVIVQEELLCAAVNQLFLTEMSLFWWAKYKESDLFKAFMQQH